MAVTAHVHGVLVSAAGWLRVQETGRLNDARWHLQNGSYAVPTGAPQLLDIFLVDTSPMIPRYKKEAWYNNAGVLAGAKRVLLATGSRADRARVGVHLVLSMRGLPLPLAHVLPVVCLCGAGGLWEQRPEVTKSQLRSYLAGSNAQWKLVAGHHPIASFGQHCKYAMDADCKQMAWLEPELNVSGLRLCVSRL